MMMLFFWFKYNLDRSVMHPKFDLTRIRTHGLQIMTVHFMCHVTETPVLTTWPSVTLKRKCTATFSKSSEMISNARALR